MDKKSNQLNTFGPLQELIEDPEVEEIWINSPSRIFVARGGQSQLTNLILSKDVVHDLIERLLIWGGRRLDVSTPFVDARLPDGSRLHVAIPEVTASEWAINIRKHLGKANNFEELVNLGSINQEMAELISKAVDLGLNILVSGGTQAGKTTFLNALLGQISTNERVITIEEVFELKPNLPDWIALLVALNSGLPGMATLHANSVRGAINKLQLLPLLAGENISQKFITPTIASSVDLVIQCSLDNNGVRRVSEVAAISGRCEDSIIEIDSIFKWNGESIIKGLGNLETLISKRNYIN